MSNNILKLLMVLSIPFTISAQSSNVVINEFMASNTDFMADEAGEFDDWIELKNNSNELVSLKDYHITDTLGILDKWKFPDDATIAANGYLVLWADEDGDQGEYHINFKLDASGEEIYLVNSDSVIVDQIIFGMQETDISFARVPDGIGNFTSDAPTFGFNNDDTSSDENILLSRFHFYPNPAKDFIQFNDAFNSELSITISRLNGELIYTKKINRNESKINISHLENGMYILNINGLYTESFIKI